MVTAPVTATGRKPMGNRESSSNARNDIRNRGQKRVNESYNTNEYHGNKKYKSNHNNKKTNKTNGYNKHTSKIFSSSSSTAASGANTRHTRKLLRKERRESKPYASTIASANHIWSVKLQNLSAKEQESKIDEIIHLLTHTSSAAPSTASNSPSSAATGNATASSDATSSKDNNNHFLSLSNKHDISRVLQLSIKYGTARQRTSIASLCYPHLLALSTGKYSYYIILKLLQYAHKDIRQKIRHELFHSKPSINELVKLSVHIHGSKVYDYLYAIAKNQYERNIMLLPFYGHDIYVLLRLDHSHLLSPPSSATQQHLNLSHILQRFPAKRTTIYNTLKHYVTRVLHKQMGIFRFIHGLLYEILQSLPSMLYSNSKNDSDDIYDSLKQASGVLWHSVAGSSLLKWMIQYGSAKDRKQVVRLLKGHVMDIAQSSSGYSVLITCFTVIDDTVLTSKVLLHDLISSSNIIPLLANPNGQKFLLWLLSPNNPAYFTKQELTVWQQRSIQRGDVSSASSAAKGDDKGDADVNGGSGDQVKSDGNTKEKQNEKDLTSVGTFENIYKKSIVMKQRELLPHLLLPLTKALAFESTLASMLQNTQSCSLLYETLIQAQLCTSRDDGGAGMGNGIKLHEKESHQIAAACDTIIELLACMCASSASSSTSAENANEKKKTNDRNDSGDNILTNHISHRFIKRLLLNLPQASIFASLLYSHIESQLSNIIASNRGTFVICSLIIAADESLKKRILNELKTYIPAIHQASKEFHDSKSSLSKEKASRHPHGHHDNKKSNATASNNSNISGFELLLKMIKGETIASNAFEKDRYDIRSHESQLQVDGTAATVPPVGATNGKQGETTEHERMEEEEDEDEDGDAVVEEYGAMYKTQFAVSDDEDENDLDDGEGDDGVTAENV